MERMKRGLFIMLCLIGVWMTAGATVPPRIPRAGGMTAAHTYRAPWMEPQRRAANQIDAPLRSIGVQKIPVVLVEFADLKFSVANNAEDLRTRFDLFCNGTRDGIRYTGAGSFGSVRDYFVQQSDSLFLPEFEVIGPVSLPNGYEYYGKDSGNSHDVNINMFVIQAASLALELVNDWTQFDNDNDGLVDLIYFIYAGEGENGSSDLNTIWPHGRVGSRTVGSLTFSAYTCSNEIYEGEMEKIGTMCHEIGHDLGLPDLYDTNGVAFGMDYWDIMDTGCYCDEGAHPCGYSAYERDFMGWRKLVELKRDEEVELTLMPVSTGGTGYKIKNPENQHEYYILENRQNTEWDTYIGRGDTNKKRHGMLVTHVDYSVSRWTFNNVNTTIAHQCYTVIPADGELYSYNNVKTKDDYLIWSDSADGDLFPGSNGVTCLFADKQPIYTSAGSMQQPLTNICEMPDGLVTLTVCQFADVNGDGVVDTQDVLGIYDYIQTQTEMSANAREDVNRDKIIDSQDVLTVYDYISRK